MTKLKIFIYTNNSLSLKIKKYFTSIFQTFLLPLHKGRHILYMYSP